MASVYFYLKVSILGPKNKLSEIRGQKPNSLPCSVGGCDDRLALSPVTDQLCTSTSPIFNACPNWGVRGVQETFLIFKKDFKKFLKSFFLICRHNIINQKGLTLVALALVYSGKLFGILVLSGYASCQSFYRHPTLQAIIEPGGGAS